MDILFEIESFDIFQSELEDILNNLYFMKKVQSSQIEGEVVEKAKQEIKTIIYNCDFDTDKISKLLQGKSWHEDKVKYFLKLMKKQKSEILCAALNHCNSTYGDTIEDFNWALKFILGTSELKTYNYSLLQLTLSFLSTSGDCKKLMYEINKEMLAKLIDCLENIK